MKAHAILIAVFLPALLTVVGVPTCALLAAIYCACVLVQRARRAYPLPRGPRGLPLIGMFGCIRSPAYEEFARWSAEYKSGVISFWRGAQLTVVFNDIDVARSAFAKGDSGLNDRALGFLAERVIIGDARSITVSPYNDFCKSLRSHVIQSFNRRAGHHAPLVERHAAELVADLRVAIAPAQADSDSIRRVLTRFSFKNVLRAVFGVGVPDSAVWSLVDELEHVNHAMFAFTTSTRGLLLDFFPLLRHLPTCLWPGRQEALELRKRRLDLCRQFVDALDLDPDCFAHQRAADPKLTDTDLRNLCSALLIAGSDGPSVALQWLVVLLASRPELQDAIHAELTSTSGIGPVQAAHIDRTPLLRAVVREVLRFRPKSFIGLPHRAARDVTVCDSSGEWFTVPQGAAVLVNSFAVDRCTERYSEEQFPRMRAARPLDEFDPSRFLYVQPTSAAMIATGDWKQRDHLAFGVGARTCPGAAFGELQLLLGAASLLKAFRITADQPLDESTMVPRLTNAPVSCAVHFDSRTE